MEEIIEQEKHEIALLTEHTLFNRIRAFSEDDSLNDEKKAELKEEAINTFVEYCIERHKALTPEQIREHVHFILNRTIENMKKLKEEGR